MILLQGFSIPFFFYKALFLGTYLLPNKVTTYSLNVVKAVRKRITYRPDDFNLDFLLDYCTKVY